MSEKNEELKEKKIEMVEIEIDMSEEMYESLAKLGLELIKNDKDALVNYATVVALKKKVKDAEAEECS